MRAWKVTTPLTVPLAPSVVQVIRSSGICSVTFAFQLRVDLATFTFQLLLVSSDFSTLTTPLAKVLNSWNCVHWSYASRTGTPTSMSSDIVTLFDLPPPPLRPLPKSPFTLSFTVSFRWEAPALTAAWAGFLPSPSALPPFARLFTAPLGSPLPSASRPAPSPSLRPRLVTVCWARARR